MEKMELLLRNNSTIAVVGLSPDPWRPSHEVTRYMREQGYTIIPVNPNHKEILGLECYPDLLSVPGSVDIVNIFRRSQAVPAIVEQAITIKAGTVWMQLGVYHEEAARIAREAGLTVIMERCIKIEHMRIFSAK